MTFKLKKPIITGFQSFEKVLIQRISSRFELVMSAGKIEAVLPLDLPEVVSGQLRWKVLNRRYTFTRENGIYKVVVTCRTAWKRNYWRKWRIEEKPVESYTGKNFLRLVNEIKQTFL